jgi:phasin
MPEIKASATSRTERPVTDAAGAAREFAQQGAAATRDTLEKTKAAAEEANKTLQQSYSTAAKGAMEFNIQWMDMLRTNANANLDFARQLFSVKSPTECLELSTAHARRQFETYVEQAQQLAGLAQKITTDAVQPLQARVASAFSKAA